MRTGNSTEGLGGQGGIPGGGGEGAGRAEKQRGEPRGPLPEIARVARGCAWPRAQLTGGCQWVRSDEHHLSGADGEAPRPGYPGDMREPPGISAGTCSPGPQGSPGPPWERPLPGQQEVLGARKIIPTTGDPLRETEGRQEQSLALGTAGWATPDAPPTTLSGLGSLWRHPQPRPQTADPDAPGHLALGPKHKCPISFSPGKVPRIRVTLTALRAALSPIPAVSTGQPEDPGPLCRWPGKAGDPL